MVDSHLSQTATTKERESLQELGLMSCRARHQQTGISFFFFLRDGGYSQRCFDAIV